MIAPQQPAAVAYRNLYNYMDGNTSYRNLYNYVDAHISPDEKKVWLSYQLFNEQYI